MGLLDAVRGAVAIANKATADLQPTVNHQTCIGQDGRGARVFNAGVDRPAIIEMKQRLVRTPNGEMTYSNATITLLDPSVVIGDRDQFTLPDGMSGVILGRKGLFDRLTGRPFLTEIYLG